MRKIPNLFKIISIGLLILAIVIKFIDDNTDFFYSFAGDQVVMFFLAISIFLFLFHLLTKNKVKRLKDSHILHSEIEYVIEKKLIRFIKKNIVLNSTNIKSIKMESNQQIIYSSGIAESIVGGVLFGGSGAIAGSIVSSKPRVSSKAIIYIETDIIQYAGLTITTTPQKGFEICKVLEALMK